MSIRSLEAHADRTRNRLIVVAWGLAIWLAWLLDHWIWSWATIGKSVESEDWWRMLRIAGFVPTWIVVALTVGLACRWRGVAWHATLAGLVSGALNGLLAELAKLVVARERPGISGLHVYRGLFAGFRDGSNLGMPSSHAAVAFGAAWAIAMTIPRARWAVLLVAAGCGVSRIVHGAHFTSDVVVAAGLGHLVGRMVSGWLGVGAGRGERGGLQ